MQPAAAMPMAAAVAVPQPQLFQVQCPQGCAPGAASGNSRATLMFVCLMGFNGILMGFNGIYGGLMGSNGIYPLVNIQKAIENGHRNSGFSH